MQTWLSKGLPCLLFCLLIASCDQLQEVVNQLPTEGPPTEVEIQAALKEALRLGIDRKVTLLAKENGFYDNPLLRIGLPEELKAVDQTLRKVGMASLADKGIRLLNRAAEDAVKEGIPIFAEAVGGITLTDARSILLGEPDAATEYLKARTSGPLYARFQPVISESFQRVGADQVWSEIISTYNEIPLVRKVDPDLSAYVTREALDGVYISVAQEEAEIRSRFTSRTTRLLQRVFALQDNR